MAGGAAVHSAVLLDAAAKVPLLTTQCAENLRD